MAKQNRIGMIAVVAVFCLLFGAPSFAATVAAGHNLVFSGATDRLSWAGGAFHIQDTTSGFGWDTFCIEYNETINLGGTFIVASVGASAIAGGRGNQSPPLLDSGPYFAVSKIGINDPISSQTAYLYYQYATGGISGVFGPGTGLQQKALQNVFWYLENEITALDASNALEMQYYNLARTATNGQFYDVAVVNPTYPNGTLAQSQLVYLPLTVPEAGALLLFGTGLVGLVGYRRVRRMQ